jgi:hypothetical protein
VALKNTGKERGLRLRKKDKSKFNKMSSLTITNNRKDRREKQKKYRLEFNISAK